MEIPRYNVLGVGIHALNLKLATEHLIAAARAKKSGYVCCCDAHSLTQARAHPSHRDTLNHAMLATPDGMPIVWAGRRSGFAQVERTYGPDLMETLCAATAGTELTHAFYGGTRGVAAELAERLPQRFPHLRVVGHHSPPVCDHVTELPLDPINATGADFVWIGLSTPKQEAFMRLRHQSTQAGGISLGVGAAFDFLTGRIAQAPGWIQRSGGEWLWRLAHEPRRLGARYGVTVPLFALRLLAQRTGLRKYPLG